MLNAWLPTCGDRRRLVRFHPAPIITDRSQTFAHGGSLLLGAGWSDRHAMPHTLMPQVDSLHFALAILQEVRVLLAQVGKCLQRDCAILVREDDRYVARRRWGGGRRINIGSCGCGVCFEARGRYWR